MNIHHLELFYYVARHGGISAAVRHMPYGIQQPAVSSQILQLEESLGVKLFLRQPFRLTSAGQELLAFVQPFFENIGPVAERLRQAQAPQLRIGTSEFILRDHLPTVLAQAKAGHSDRRFSLRSGTQVELEAWLREDAVDLAVMPLPGRLPPRLRCVRLLSVPLVLLVPRKSKLKSTAELWAQKKISDPLISLPPTERISQLFQAGLKRRGITWPQSVEASSMALITTYVALGDGLGVNAALPEVVRHPQVRVLPLEGFDPIELGAVWQGEPKPALLALLEEMQRYAGKMTAKAGGA
jgi:DNA-binding transcriptional LysR family regulator